MTQYVAITYPGTTEPGVRLVEPYAVGPFEVRECAEIYVELHPLSGSWRWRIVELQEPMVAVAA